MNNSKDKKGPYRLIIHQSILSIVNVNYHFLFSFSVTLSKTVKKGLERKKSLRDELVKAVEKYENIFVFSVQNMRNSKLKDVRNDWKDSR